MSSTLIWSRAQFVQAFSKSLAGHVSNALGGKTVKLVQFSQVPPIHPVRACAELKSNKGNSVKLSQSFHAPLKSSTRLVFMPGKEAKFVHLDHTPTRDSADEKSSRGKSVKPVQSAQVPSKYCPELMLTSGKEVRPEQSLHVDPN